MPASYIFLGKSISYKGKKKKTTDRFWWWNDRNRVISVN